MIKLKTKQLLDFIRLSSPIISNSILPIHKYLRLTKDGVLSKTSGRIFLCQEIEVVGGEDILLEENAFNAFVKFTRADEVTIATKEVKGSKDTKVTLSDGSTTQSFQSPPIKDFDILPAFEDADAVELDSEVLQAIGISSSCVSNIGGGANFDFVHLNDNYVFGTDRYKLYAKKMSGLPNAYFDVDCAKIISQFNSVDFCKKDNYNLFKSGKILYGFQQFGDVKAPNIKPFVQNGLQGGHCEFQAADFLRFCELVTASIPVTRKDEVLECTMNGGELYCLKEEYGKEVKMTIPVDGEFIPSIKFNPKFHAPYIRSLGIPTIHLYDFPKVGVYIGDPDDKEFIGMISSLVG